MDMSAVDVATVIVLSIALFLQVYSGIALFLSKIDSLIGFEDVADGVPPTPLAYSQGKIGGFRGGGRGILWRLYTKKEDEDVRVYTTPWRGILKIFYFPPKEFDSVRLLLRQLALLSLAVMGIIRFAMGEPILNLF